MSQQVFVFPQPVRYSKEFMPGMQAMVQLDEDKL